MVVYSHSKISAFEQCPLKFKFRYIEGIIPEIEETIESHLGKIVHNTLEWIYSQVKESRSASINDIIEYYTENWEENYKAETPIARKELTEQDYFNMGVKFLVDYFNEHAPFEDGTLECEKEIIINLDEEGKYKIRGFIDRLVYNLETEEYEIHDYKTANNLPQREKIESDRQLALYAIAVKELFGQDKEVRLIWHYLAHNKIIHSKRTNEQLEQLKKETLELVKEIESAQDFPANKSPLCDWCAFKSVCPEFDPSLMAGREKFGEE